MHCAVVIRDSKPTRKYFPVATSFQILIRNEKTLQYMSPRHMKMLQMRLNFVIASRGLLWLVHTWLLTRAFGQDWFPERPLSSSIPSLSANGSWVCTINYFSGCSLLDTGRKSRRSDTLSISNLISSESRKEPLANEP
jgi:hypothetical protein